MSDCLTIDEHRSSAWKMILIVSLAIAILFFILFSILNNPLWVGILRIVAFVGFAGFVLAILQLQGKKQRIEIETNDEHLQIIYSSSTQNNQDELFELKTIQHIEKKPAPPIWKFIPRNDCSKLQISFTDTPNILSMLRYQDRDLYISHSDAERAIQFLDHHLPSAIK